MPGPPPKDPQLRQRTNKKAGAGALTSPTREVPEIPNPGVLDKETGQTVPIEWHPLTLQSWTHAWESPMASRWLESDIDGLGRVALLWDVYYRSGDAKILSEIRLQEQRFGLSPLDRSRLQWEVKRGEDAERERTPAPSAVKPGVDLRRQFKVVNG